MESGTVRRELTLLLLLLLVWTCCCENSTDSVAAFRNTEWSLGRCRLVIDGTCPDRDVSFFLYTRSNPTDSQQIDTGEGILNITNSNFNSSHPTKFVIHGYNADMNLDVLVDIREAYLKEGEYNVIAVDWSRLGPGPCYPTAVYNARFVGKCIAQHIQTLRLLNASDIHLVGFSLGAHVASFAANNLRPYKLPRITGLDPAMPFFVTTNKDHKLDASDAEFVDVIHTNAFVQGKIEASGDVDFYVNGGMNQPGCWSESNPFACDHHRAPAYFAESITSEKGFWGWHCLGFVAFLFGLCPPRYPAIIMGDKVPSETRGFLLVTTNFEKPFALGRWVLSPQDDTRPKHRDKFPANNEVFNQDDCAVDEELWTYPTVLQVFANHNIKRITMKNSCCMLLSLLVCFVFADKVPEIIEPVEGVNQSGETVSQPTPKANVDASTVIFRLYTNENPSTYTAIIIGDDSTVTGLDTSLPTRFYIHGWRSSADNGEFLKDDYLSVGKYNVILVDWSALANTLYLEAQGRVKDVGAYVASFLDYLVTKGVSLSTVAIAGHSLGAHIAGVAGNRVSGTLAKITGLDPAYPLYDNEPSENKLDSSDASFVEVIHTCGGLLGIKDPLGHADFYPNGGVPTQPGCGLDLAGSCSHSRSHDLFGESITTSVGFYGHKCSSWDDYEAGSCSSNPTALMGEFTSTSASGSYYLKTASESPYALGP
ncbi:uncharacterized protein [Periplaneta americana]|uniref:uncharacterized protein n=1 Tax=Periplaneta americana TaxID=6978 RepID=UPI0037E76886